MDGDGQGVSVRKKETQNEIVRFDSGILQHGEGHQKGSWSYVKKTDTDFRESADTANSTKDFLRFLP